MTGPRLLLLLSCFISGCGNIEWSSSINLSAGQTVTLTAGSYVYVPSGTTVTSGGSVVTIYGHNNTFHTRAGAVVSAPSNASGASDNLVTTL